MNREGCSPQGLSTLYRNVDVMLLPLLLASVFITAGASVASAPIERVYTQLDNPRPKVPCLVVKPTEKISTLSWFRGQTMEAAQATGALVQYVNQDVHLTGTNQTQDERYRLTKDWELFIGDLREDDTGRYWCRVVLESTGELREEPVDFVVVIPVKPVITPCRLSETDICNVNESRRLVTDCSVTRVFPSPDLTWSLVGCSDDRNETQRWFVSNQLSSFDQNLMYNVSVDIYLGMLTLDEDEDCSFECSATGEGVIDGYSVQTLVVSGIPRTRPPTPTDDDDDDGSGNDGTNKSLPPNLTTTIVIIVLALLSLVCLIGIVYFTSRVRCQRNRDAEREDIEMKNPKDNQDEKVCLLNAETDEGNTKDIIGALTRWRYKGRLSKMNAVFGESLRGVTGVVPTAGGGLMVASQSGLQSFSSKFSCLSLKEDFSQENILSLASHPSSDGVAVGLERGGLVFLHLQTGKTKSVFPNGLETDAEFSSSTEIAIDDLGALFAGERNNRSISLIEIRTHYSKKYKIDMDLVSLAAYGSKHVFVSNGKDTIQKYHFKNSTGKRGVGYDMLKFKNKISIDSAGSYGITHISVHAGLLYAVSSLTEIGCEITQHDVETFDLLQTFATNLADLRGLCFFGEFKVAVYDVDSVKIYEKRERNGVDSYVAV